MKKAMLGIGVAAVGAAAALYKVGEEFDDAYDKIQTRTGATGREMRKLKGVFRDVISDVPATFDEAATAVGDLNTRLGLTGKPLARVSKQMTELSRLTDTSLAGNVESVSKAFVDWEVKTKDMSKTLDGLFRLSQESGASVEEITSAVQKFGSPLRQLGFSLAEASAMWATFVRAGVNTQTMVPGLKLAISNLTRPTDELGASMEKLGINVGKPDKALQQIFDLLGKQSTLSQIEKTGLAMDVFGKRAGADMAEAIRQGRFEVDDMLKVFRNGEGTIREQGRRTMDLAEHWQQFTNLLKLQVEPIAKDVFKGLGDLMKDVSKAFKREGASGALQVLIDKFTEILPKVAELGGQIGIELIKGIAKAFWESPILGKLFIAGTFIHFIGGSGVLTALGTALGNPIGQAAAVAIAGFIAYELEKEHHFAGEALFQRTTYFDSDAFDKELASLTDMNRQGIYKIVREWQMMGFQVTKEQIYTWQQQRKISLDGALALIAVIERMSKNTREAYEKLAEGARKAGGSVRDFASKAGDWLRAFSKTGRGNLLDLAQTFKGPLERALDRSGDAVKDFADKAGDAIGKFKDRSDRDLGKVGDSFGRTTDRSGKMAKGVGQNITALANGVATGLDVLKDNLNKSLAAFKVKKVGYSIKKVGNTVGNVVGAQKGAIVPGTGSGDKVPLHLDGRLAAMVEPGELVSVANRTATDRLMAVNKAVPRRQDGGLVPHLAAGGVANDLAFALGPYTIPPIQYDANHAGGNSHWHISANSDGPWIRGIGKRLQQMGFMVGEHPAFGGVQGGHGSYGPSDHYHGGAIDVNSAADETKAETARVAALISGNAVAGAAGAVAKKLAKLILQGPDGPLKELGQGILDKAHAAASAFLAKQAPNGLEGPVGAPIKSLPDALQKYNRLFPQHTLSNPGYQMPVDAVAALAEWRGMPGITMAQIAHGESNYYPGVVGSDADAGYGNTFGYGLWQITSGVGNESLVKGYGGFDQMLNPVKNAMVAGEMYDAAGGLSPWFGTRFLTDPNAHYTGPLLRKHGGIVPHLAKGGLVEGLDKVLSVTRRSDKAKRKRRVLKDYVERLKGIGLNEDLTEALKSLDEKQAQYGEYADYASSLAEDGIDRFKGKGETEWLGLQLGSLFKLRNKLVRAEKVLSRRRRELKKLLTYAEKQQKAIKRAVGDADKEKDEIQKQIDREKKQDKPNKDLIEHLEKRIGSIDERKEMRNAGLAALKDKLIPAIKGKSASLTELYTTHHDRLADVQGTGMPLEHLKSAPYGQLGGEILTVQQRIREVGGDTTARDADRLEIIEGLLRESQQRFAISQRQYGVFASTPVLGAFAKGGTAMATGAYLVGERGPEVVHLSSGDRVSPNPTISTTPAVNVSVTLYEDRDKALVDVNGKEFVAAVKRVNRKGG